MMTTAEIPITRVTALGDFLVKDERAVGAHMTRTKEL